MGERSSFRMLAVMAALLRPGVTVPTSGVYRVRHESHRAEHLVTAIKGERLPACRSCGANVSFELMDAADYVMQERDFKQMLAAS
jgi:hypothetical protein